MASYDRFTIEASPEIISMLREKIKDCAEDISVNSSFCSVHTLHVRANQRDSEQIVNELKAISEREPDEIIRFEFSAERNRWSETECHEMENGHRTFTGMIINYAVDYDDTKLPEAIREIIDKLKALDTIKGEKVIYFPKTTVDFTRGGEDFIIIKNNNVIELTAYDMDTRKKTTKYDIAPPSNLELRSNNCQTLEECALCGGPVEPQVPLWVFRRGTYEPVCTSCVEAHNPEMAHVLEVFYEHERDVLPF